ncbi:MAG: tetratricopeptide repeat protein [Candidatus Rokuibacteriota bacterium]
MGRKRAKRPGTPAAPPGDPDALARAIDHHRAGRLDEAEDVYRRVLVARPRDPDALHYLGVLSHQRGRGEEAVALIRRAVGAAPDYADAHTNLGNVLKELGRLEEAAASYRRALELSPHHAPTISNLGATLRALGRLDEAVAQHRRALELAPRSATAHLNLGNALRERGDLDGAIAAFFAAVEIQPSIGAYQGLGRALYRAGRSPEAIGVFQAWLQQEPGNPIALHMLAACSGHDVPARASDGYVQRIFDDMAEGYDDHLRDLGYRGPELARQALATAAGSPRRALDVLDAGCGTGLCGAVLRPYARRLAGVDLSDSMLARARGRGVYDELVAAELTAYLAGHARAFDLVLVADTLVYFGDLAPVLAAAAGALRPDGLLVFTVESAEEEGDAPPEGYRLNVHGRYSHAAAYLREALAAFTAVSILPATLRHEVGRPVAGYVVTARAVDP